MNLLSDVQKLQQLEQHAHYPYLVYVMSDIKTSCYCKTDEDARFVSEMRNLAPGMLEVLGQFREGDVNRLEEMISWMEAQDANAKENGIADGFLREEIAVLQRLQAMCAKMEEIP